MRIDRTGFGLFFGLLAPLMGFLAYSIFIVTVLHPDLELGFFLHGLVFGIRGNLAPALSLSLLTDVALFFWFDRLRWLKAMRGVIGAMFVYGIVIIIFLVLWGRDFM